MISTLQSNATLMENITINFLIIAIILKPRLSKYVRKTCMYHFLFATGPGPRLTC